MVEKAGKSTLHLGEGPQQTIVYVRASTRGGNTFVTAAFMRTFSRIMKKTAAGLVRRPVPVDMPEEGKNMVSF